MLRRALPILIVAGVVSACGDSSVIVSGSPAAPSSVSDITTSVSTTTFVDAMRAQIATATNEVCGVVGAENVRLSFHEISPLATLPMGESSGPACGYADPREGVGGYVLVIQFQDLGRWDGHVATGRRVEGLGRDAVVSRNVSAELLVLDLDRAKVVLFVAPSPPQRSHEPLFDVAASVYGVPREGVRLAA